MAAKDYYTLLGVRPDAGEIDQIGAQAKSILNEMIADTLRESDEIGPF